MRTFLFHLLLILLCSELNAQEAGLRLSDSLKWAFEQEPRVIGRLSTRNAFITGRPVRTYELKGGLNFGNRVSVGIGYHWLKHGDTYAFTREDGTQDLREIRMHYIAGFFEYAFIVRKNWEITLPFVIGIGNSREFILREVGRSDALNRAGVVLYEPGIVAEYHFLKYFAVGGGLGLRLMLKNNRRIDQQFTAPIWEMRFRIKLGEIWRDQKHLFEQ